MDYECESGYSIAIRSKGRSDTIKEKTLKLLDKWNILNEKIHIFVPENEIDIYQEKYPLIKILNGGSSITECNNLIIDYFPEGHYVIQMDDDIHFLLQLGDDNDRIKVNNKLRPKGFIDLNLNKLIKSGYRMFHSFNYKIWGLYPVVNDYYMTGLKTPTFDLSFIIGRIFGFINCKITRTFDKCRDDYERSILYFKKDNGIVRFNHYACLADTYVGANGLAEERTIKLMDESAQNMINTYPDYVREKKCKSKYREIRLVKKKRTVY